MIAGSAGVTGTAGTVATEGVGAGGGAASAALSNRSTTNRLPYWAFGARELQSLSTFVYEGVRISQLQFGPGNAAAVFIFVTAFLIALFFIKVLGMQTSAEE